MSAGPVDIIRAGISAMVGWTRNVTPPEANEDRGDRFGWTEDDAEGLTLTSPDGTVIPWEDEEEG